jgi:gamma-glutamyltranspeptidase
VELIQSKGGIMTSEDLASHTTTRVEPLSIEYKGVKVWECPPNGQGMNLNRHLKFLPLKRYVYSCKRDKLFLNY